MRVFALASVALMALTSARTARATNDDNGTRPDAKAIREERLDKTEHGFTLEAPFGGGAVGGLGGVEFSRGAERSTGHALGLPSALGTVGPHIGVALNLGGLYAAAGYDYSGLIGRGALHHASIAVGVTLPLANNAFAPFLAPSVRVWSFGLSGPDDSATWSSGLRVSPALEAGARITPWLVWSRKSPDPVRVGIVARGSVPVATEGGWIATASISLFGGL
jgi:hypothetical protein